MHAVTVTVAQYGIVLVGLGALLAWWQAGRHDRLTMLAAGVVALVLLFVGIQVAAHLWVDPRPFVVDHTTPWFAHPPDNGFPSDHSALGAAVAVVVAFWRRRLGLLLLVVALLVGAARVLAGVHHVPDVVGGALIGAVSAGLAVVAVRRGARALSA